MDPSIERGFRWIRETVALIYAHHHHPLPMTALIFMYAETLGKPLTKSTKKEDRVCVFVEGYLPKLWAAFAWSTDRRRILGDHYRNGLVHQMFMKENAGIHEDKDNDTEYVSRNFASIPYSVNIDRLVPEFLDGINAYYRRLETDSEFRKKFEESMGSRVET